MATHSSEPSGRPSADASFPPVVTIWEEYGSGADAIGRSVAEKLGLPYHQQAFSSEQIEAGDAPQDEADTARTIADRLSLSQVFAAMGGAYGGGDGMEYIVAQREKRELIQDNNATVQRYADEGGVIVGRNATKILAERPRILHVLLTADARSRVARAAELAGISSQQAEKRRQREDKVRSDMSISLYGWDPREPEHYDLMINTGRIPHDAAVEAIVHAVEHAV
jgi:cytidylate kinase